MASITIQSKTISGFHWVSVTSGEVRVYASRDFTTSDGKLIQSGSASNTDGFYVSAAFTVAGSTITIAQFTLDSTTDARVNSTARYNAYLFSSTGQLIGPFAPFSNFILSHVWGGYDGACGGNTTCTTWDAIAIYNQAAVNRPRDMQTYSRTEILAMLAAVSMQTFSFALPLRYNSGTNVISIDKATGLVDGYLAAADFTTFAAKASPFTVTGGGLTYGSNQIGLTAAGATSLGYLTSTDWNTFNNKQGTIAVSGSGLTFDGTTVGLTQAGTGSLGWLSAANWNTFNNKQAPISVSGGALTFGSNTVGLAQATTNTSGWLSSTDWNTFNNKLTSYTPVAPIVIGSGNISITKADAGTNGYLAAADFITFSGKDVVTTAAPPLVRSVGNQYSIPRSSGSVDGYLAMGDWTTFNNKQATVSATPPLFIASNNLTIQVANGSQNGYLSFSDWTTFNNKQATVTVNGSSDLTFAGNQITLGRASGSTSGTLSSTDWNTFNSKQATITVNGSSDLVFAGNQITLGRAGVATSGTLSTTDWNTFNNKQATISVAGTGYLSLAGATLDVVPNTHNQQVRILDNSNVLKGQRGTVTFKNATTAGHGWSFTDTGTAVEITPTLTTLPASAPILVGTGRQILTDATLSGGGDLSADRTLGVVSNTSTQMVEVYFGGSSVKTCKRINFTGSGILSVADGGTDTVTIQTTSSAGGAYNTVKEEGGAALPQRSVLNFKGAAITAADNAGQTDITLSQLPITSTSVVGTETTIATGLGLTGGGDLTANRTLSVVTNSTVQKVELASNTALVGSGRKRLDFSTAFAIAEDAINDEYTVDLSLGTANQVIGMNAGATAYERKSILPGTGISIAHAAGSMTINAAAALMDKVNSATLLNTLGTASPGRSLYSYAVPASALEVYGSVVIHAGIRVTSAIANTTYSIAFFAGAIQVTVTGITLTTAGLDMVLHIEASLNNQNSVSVNGAEMLLLSQTTSENPTVAFGSNTATAVKGYRQACALNTAPGFTVGINAWANNSGATVQAGAVYARTTVYP